MPGREGSGCCGSNVRKSLGWGPGRQGEGRSESSWDGYREEESEGDEPREECGDGEGSGESPVCGQERVRCGDGEESTAGTGKGLV